MRMQPHRRIQPVMLRGQLDPLPTPRHIKPNVHDARHARLVGPTDHRVPILIETRPLQMRMTIHEHRSASISLHARIYSK